jgi:hypothetical protein
MLDSISPEVQIDFFLLIRTDMSRCCGLQAAALAAESEVQALREQVAELEAALARERERTQVY